MATATLAADQISYEDLYARWEKGNWSATEIDFSRDHEDWHNRLEEVQRRAALWNYALFFHGEDSVADNLSPYIDAAPREEQKYFLTTQQVDEARHAVFFARFMRDVANTGGETLAETLERTRPELTWGFRKTFDRLDRMADELRADRSKPKLAAAVTLYHVVIEAALAQPGQHFIEDFWQGNGLMPGFQEGMENVARDEQRHIGFGVKLLADLVREDPECRYAVADLLREVIPWTTAVLVPPPGGEGYAESLGFTLEEIYTFGAQSMESKLAAAGLPLEELPGRPPLPYNLTPEQRADRGLLFLRSGVVGEKLGPTSSDPAVQAELFDALRMSVVHQKVAVEPTTVQWDFSDAAPWFLRVDNGSTSVEQGRLEQPDVVIHSSFEDWADVAVGREDARLAIAKRRLRPKGSPRALWRMTKLLA